MSEEKARELFKEAANFYFRGMSGPCAEHLEEIVKLSQSDGSQVPEDILRDTHRNLGLLYTVSFANAYHKGAEHFTEALRLGTHQDYDFCRNYGCSLFLLKRYDECVRWLREACALKDEDNVARSFLGVALVEVAEHSGDYRLIEEAKTELERLESRGSIMMYMLRSRIDTFYLRTRGRS
jgi:tetratricopeptide (TPR) repeat protein